MFYPCLQLHQEQSEGHLFLLQVRLETGDLWVLKE